MIFRSHSRAVCPSAVFCTRYSGRSGAALEYVDAAGPLPEPVYHGLVGFIELGQTEVAKTLDGALYTEIVTRYHHPYYQVPHEGGDTEEHTGQELARILKLKVSQETDPRRFNCDWSGLSITDVSGFVGHLAGCLAPFGFKLPSAWTNTDTSTEGKLEGELDSTSSIEAYLREKEN